MRDHLAIFAPGPLAAILAGRKTVESRFAVDRRLPWGRVAAGDRIWLKRAGGPIVGVAEAAWVRSFAGLTPAAVAELFCQHPEILADPAYCEAKSHAAYATLIGLANVRRVEPLALPGRGRSGWRLMDAPPPLRDRA
jgi:hypothetical protein